MKRLMTIIITTLLCITVFTAVFANAAEPTETSIFSADFNTAATPSAAGISQTDWNERTFPGTMKIESGKLVFTTPEDNTSTFGFEFLTYNMIKDYEAIKIEFDISSAKGGKNTAGNDYSVGLVFAKKDVDNHTSLQFAGKTFNLAFAAQKSAAVWLRTKNEYRFDLADKAVTTGLNVNHNISVILDYKNNVMTYSVDGKEMESAVPMGSETSGVALEIYGKDVEVYIDNIVAKGMAAPAIDTQSTTVTTAAATTTKATVTTVTTAAKSETEAVAATTTSDEDKSGCKASLTLGITGIVIVGFTGALVSKKKKDD